MAISQLACPSSVIYPCTFFIENYPFLWAQNPNLARIQAEERTRRSLTEWHGVDKTIMSQSCWQPEWVRQEIIKFSFAIANSLVYFCDRSAGWQRLNEAQILTCFIYIPCTTAWFGFFIDLTSCFTVERFFEVPTQLQKYFWSTYAISEILLMYLSVTEMSPITKENKHFEKMSCGITVFRSAGQESKHCCATYSL